MLFRKPSQGQALTSRLASAALAGCLLASPPVRAWGQAAEPDQQAAPSPSAGAATMDVLDNRRLLENGDIITYRVVEDRGAPHTLRVTDSGEVEIPLLGPVRAKDRTCKEFAFVLKNSLERDLYHRATVIVSLQSASPAPAGKIYLTGQVVRQGPLELPAKETLTVSKAILANGGFSDFANQRRVKVNRKGPDGKVETIVVDVKAVLEQGRIEKDVALQPEDIVVVPERLINF